MLDSVLPLPADPDSAIRIHAAAVVASAAANDPDAGVS
jgi:hypothetical protein